MQPQPHYEHRRQAMQRNLESESPSAICTALGYSHHLVRFVRSDSLVDVFGEKFQAPPEAVYEYVRLTIDVARQRLSVYLLDTLIDEHIYLFR